MFTVHGPMARSPKRSGLTILRREETLVVAMGLFAAIGSVAEGLTVGEAIPVVLLVVPLLWRMQHPLAVLIVIMSGVLAYLIFVARTPVALPPLFVALYTVAAHGERRRTLAVALAVLPFAVIIGRLVSAERGGVLDFAAQLSQFGFALVLGEAVRTQRALIGALRERAQRAELDRELEARRRVDEERVRMARDVHDTVAHNIAAITTQASVGLYVGREQPERALEALERIKAVGTQALRDLRHALGNLRTGSGGGTDPTPSARDVPRLVQQARDSGVSVVLETRGSAADLPAALGVAVYRIVQEALTNVMRHAGGSSVAVRLSVGKDEIEVVIADDGRGSPTLASASGTGSGLEGMRERAAALGGALEAGPTPRSGYRVRAVLPLEREPA